jgi:hypothetical protein
MLAESKSKCMKKIMILLIVVMAAGAFSSELNAQPPWAKAWGKRAKEEQRWRRGQYYYYPSANVYYSPASHRYWYPRNGVWMNVGVLPPSVIVYNQPSHIVYRDYDDDIWRDNYQHISRYRPQPVYVERPRRSGVSIDVRARF